MLPPWSCQQLKNKSPPEVNPVPSLSRSFNGYCFLPSVFSFNLQSEFVSSWLQRFGINLMMAQGTRHSRWPRSPQVLRTVSDGLLLTSTDFYFSGRIGPTASVQHKEVSEKEIFSPLPLKNCCLVIKSCPALL